MKTDLHIHTISTQWDAPFEFSINKLVEYVTTFEINAIAITNHNCFNLNQFQQIKDVLEGQAIVFPGIEVTVAPNNAHLLIISESSNIENFVVGCRVIEDNILEPHDCMDIYSIEAAFSGFDDYLIIPHYDKNPAISKDVLKQIEKNVICGEVSSAKKYIRVKNSEEITPVVFSDARMSEYLDFNKTKQTHLTIGEVTLPAIKLCLKDKTKVALTASMNDE